ncbi:MAG: F0F1 ATP synthase subunit B [Pseudomonadota bacterium]
MWKYLPLAVIATPALAASDKPFFSLANTDFIVLISFILFIGVLVYFKVPGIVTGALDKRAETIKSELDEARRLREEAQSLLASYERKAREVEEQAAKIVDHAKLEAEEAADAAKAEIAATIERRLQGAKDRIASAEAAAIRDVKNRAAEVAVAAASDVIRGQMTDAERGRLVDDAIGTVKQKLH